MARRQPGADRNRTFSGYDEDWSPKAINTRRRYRRSQREIGETQA